MLHTVSEGSDLEVAAEANGLHKKLDLHMIEHVLRVSNNFFYQKLALSHTVNC